MANLNGFKKLTGYTKFINNITVAKYYSKPRQCTPSLARRDRATNVPHFLAHIHVLFEHVPHPPNQRQTANHGVEHEQPRHRADVLRGVVHFRGGFVCYYRFVRAVFLNRNFESTSFCVKAINCELNYSHKFTQQLPQKTISNEQIAQNPS